MTSISDKPVQLSDKTSYWLALFVCLLTLTGVLIVILLSEPLENSHGIGHAEFSTMKIGAASDRHQSPVIWMGLLYAVSQYVFLVASLLLGLSQLRPAACLVGLIGSLGVAILSTLFVFYNNSLSEPTELTLGFPTASAWMVYVLWPLPILFIVLYCVKFDDWFYPTASRERFEKLLAARPTGGQN